MSETRFILYDTKKKQHDQLVQLIGNREGGIELVE